MRGPWPEKRFVRRCAHVRHVVVALVMLAMLCGPLAHDVAASKAWCRTDPIVVIDGHVTDIFVAGPLKALLVATGPTDIVVTVPEGVSAWLLLADLGFGRGVNVSFAESPALSKSRKGAEIEVAVFVPASENIPIRVEVASRILGLLWPASAEGTANSWLVLRTRA